MLAETVDTELWHAQRVLQSASTDAVNLSGCDALTRALDVAAGDAAALSGNRAAADRANRQRVRPLLHPDRPPDRGVDGGDQGAGRRQPGGRALRRGGRRGRRPGAAPRRADRRTGRSSTEQQQSAATRQDRGPGRRRRHRPAHRTGAGSRVGRRRRDCDQHRVDRLRTPSGSGCAPKTIRAQRLSQRWKTRPAKPTKRRRRRIEVTVEADGVVERSDQLLMLRPSSAPTQPGAWSTSWPVATRRNGWPPGSRKSTRRCASGMRSRKSCRRSLSPTICSDRSSRPPRRSTGPKASSHWSRRQSNSSRPPISSWSSATSGCRCRRAKPGRPSRTPRPRSRFPAIVTARVTPGTSALDIQAKYAAAQEKLAAVLGGGAGRRSWLRLGRPISGAANCRAPATSSPRRWPDCPATTTSSSCARGWPNCEALPVLSDDVAIDAAAARAELARGGRGPRPGRASTARRTARSRRWR